MCGKPGYEASCLQGQRKVLYLCWWPPECCPWPWIYGMTKAFPHMDLALNWLSPDIPKEILWCWKLDALYTCAKPLFVKAHIWVASVDWFDHLGSLGWLNYLTSDSGFDHLDSVCAIPCYLGSFGCLCYPMFVEFPPNVFTSQSTRHSTRDHTPSYSILHQPFARTTSYMSSFIPSSIALWNNLPPNVVTARSTYTFKTHVAPFYFVIVLPGYILSLASTRLLCILAFLCRTVIEKKKEKKDIIFHTMSDLFAGKLDLFQGGKVERIVGVSKHLCGCATG